MVVSGLFGSWVSKRGAGGLVLSSLVYGLQGPPFLSSILFNICTKLQRLFIWRAGLDYHQYGDDTQLCLVFPEDPREAVETMTQFLEEVLGWIGANKLKLNPNELEELLVGGKIDLGTEVSSNLDGDAPS